MFIVFDEHKLSECGGTICAQKQVFVVFGASEVDAVFSHLLNSVSKSMTQKRVAIVGAGPSGLTSARHVFELFTLFIHHLRHAILNGFDVVIFDKRSAVGGRWSSDTTQGCGF